MSAPTPRYTVTPSTTSIEEGAALTTTVSTTGVSQGTQLYWQIDGLQSADLSSGALNGTGTVDAVGSFTVSHTIKNDATTEGNEIFNIKLYSEASHENELGASGNITVIDTSLTPATTEAITSASLISTVNSIYNTPTNGEALYYYIHPGGDIANVGFNGSGTPTQRQTIDSSPLESYITSIIAEIDSFIDLDFARTYTKGQSKIDFYAVEDDLTSVVGTTYFWSSRIDISFEITGNTAFNKYIVVHELGHAIGLNHPFNSGPDPRYTADSTVMSYNVGTNGWTDYFRSSDLEVLKTIWGAENDTPIVLVGGGSSGGGGGGGAAGAGDGGSPSSGGGGDPGIITIGPPSSVTTTPTTTESTEPTPTATSPSPVTPTPSQESPVLGIQPQSAVTTVQLTTPLTLGNLQVTQAVVGTPERDVITGSDKGEALAGGKGKDQMTGGGGPDAFIFETPGDFGKKNADVITDFNPDEGDKVAIASEAFDGLTKIKFVAVTGKKEAKRMGSTNKSFIYDDKKGMLYYDANGRKNGLGADGGEFAQLLGAPNIGKSNLVIA